METRFGPGRINSGAPVRPGSKPRTLDWASYYVDMLGLRALEDKVGGLKFLDFLGGQRQE